MLQQVFAVVSSLCLLNGALASSNLTGIFLGGVSAAGPSHCLNGIAASTGTPAYGSYANSAYPMTLNCAQTTWLPLGSTSSGTPILHAIYYAPSLTVSASETTQQTLVTNLIQNLASTSYYAPLQTYYDGCSGQAGGNLYFKSIQWGEWTHITCSQVGTSCSSITWTDEQSILAYVFNNKLYPQNLDVWALIVDPAITEYLVDSSGARFTLGTSYCSYHAVYDYTGQGGHWIDYSVVQANTGSACTLNLASTSNGVQYDSFIYNMMHEVIETITAPAPSNTYNPAMWMDSQKNEVMDKCDCVAANVNNGYNIAVGSKKYVLPSIFNRLTNSCVMNGNSGTGSGTPPTSSCPHSPSTDPSGQCGSAYGSCPTAALPSCSQYGYCGNGAAWTTNGQSSYNYC